MGQRTNDRGEGAPAAADARLRHLLNSTPSIIYATNARDNFACTFVTDNIREVLGYDAAEMTSDPEFWSSRIHPDDRDRVLREFVGQIGQGTGEMEYRFRCSNGMYLWLHDTYRLFYDDDGRPREIIGSWTDVTSRRQLADRLSYQATHDALTGLVNRHEFEKRLERSLESAAKRGWYGALCYLDLDQFKVINDSLGHVAGDRALRELGALMSEKVRERDTLARLGGDEFALILEHCNLADAERIAETMREAIEEFRFVWDGHSHKIGISIGVARLDESIALVTDALQQADSACFMAKEAGRNRVYVYTEYDRDVEQRRLEIRVVGRVSDAVENGRFALYCQPIVPLDAAREHGRHLEVLLRMLDADGRRVPPDQFLPAAERYGFANRIDRWVIGQTLAWFASHPEQAADLAVCSVNLSGHSFGDMETADFIAEALAQSRLDPRKLCLEITETAAVSNLAAAVRFITKLRDLGVKFALDDFGSGFSSFAYLGKLPVDYLKIDGAFVRDICTNRVHEAFVRAISDVGRVMDLETIAEYVENADIANVLAGLGVDFVQGYGIGRPCPLDTLADASGLAVA